MQLLLGRDEAMWAGLDRTVADRVGGAHDSVPLSRASSAFRIFLR